MVEARINGVVFEQWPSNYDRCFVLDRNGVKGWRGGDLRRDEVNRPFDHGAFDSQGFQAQRTINISGTILAGSAAELQYMKDQLAGVLAAGASGKLTVDDESGTTWRNVRLAAVADPEDLDDESATYGLTFWAADPRRYGEARTFAAGGLAYHYGNFPATPRLLVGAGSGGYTITGPGGRVVTVNSNAPSSAHSIDFVTGGLFNASGGRVANAITVYQPWTVAPGAQVSVSITGSRSLSQRVTDTFI